MGPSTQQLYHEQIDTIAQAFVYLATGSIPILRPHVSALSEKHVEGSSVTKQYTMTTLHRS
jgi:hypothetical protein